MRACVQANSQVSKSLLFGHKGIFLTRGKNIIIQDESKSHYRQILIFLMSCDWSTFWPMMQDAIYSLCWNFWTTTWFWEEIERERERCIISSQRKKEHFNVASPLKLLWLEGSCTVRAYTVNFGNHKRTFPLSQTIETWMAPPLHK